MTDIKTTPEKGFEILSRTLNKEGPEAQKRIAAHFRVLMGRHMPLPLYHHDKSIPDDEKITQYSLCVRAVLSRNYSILKGQDGAPAPEQEQDKRIDPADLAKPEPKPEPAVVEPPEPATIPELPNPNLLVADIRSRTSAMSPIARAIFDEIAPFLPKPDDKPLEVDAVRKIAEEVFTHQMNNGGLPVERIKELIEESIPTTRIEVTLPDGKVVRIDGQTHWQFPQILAWLEANAPVWTWGDAGGGKTTLGYQLAKALNLAPCIISVDPTMTVGKLLGYRNLATGDYVEGLIYRAFRNGGLVMLDEIDTGDPGILAAANALISNERYLFPNGETVEKHADFRLMAGANTKGCGATAGYTARNKLDAATLDRFAVIQLGYDEELEAALALGRPKQRGKVWEKADTSSEDRAAQCERWVEYVKKARNTVDGAVLISPRASILGCRAIRVGVPVMEVADALLFKLTSSDTRQNILNSCGVPQ